MSLLEIGANAEVWKRRPLPEDRALRESYQRSTPVATVGDAAYKSAGVATETLNASFSAADVPSQKRQPHVPVLMEDYQQANRTLRRTVPVNDSVASLISHGCSDANDSLLGVGSTRTTKFGAGFVRRQQTSIEKSGAKREQPSQKQSATSELRRERLVQRQSFAYHGYDIISGAELAGGAPPRRLAAPCMDAKRTIAAGESAVTTGADSQLGRLRDSTSRFHCTPQELPTTERRRELLSTEGLVETQRKSALLGVGPGCHEIASSGAEDNFRKSEYAIRRRADAMELDSSRRYRHDTPLH